MSIEITHVHTEPVHQNTHEAITHYAWRELGTSDTSVSCTKPQLVAWLRQGIEVFVGTGALQVPVIIHYRPGVETYVQTVSDGVWGNNLLALPRF